jgi:hypothetical protein
MCWPFWLMTSVGKLLRVMCCMVALYHLQTYSQFFSSSYTDTGLKPTKDLAVLEMTDEAPVLEKALPGSPVFPDSCSLDAS